MLWHIMYLLNYSKTSVVPSGSGSSGSTTSPVDSGGLPKKRINRRRKHTKNKTHFALCIKKVRFPTAENSRKTGVFAKKRRNFRIHPESSCFCRILFLPLRSGLFSIWQPLPARGLTATMLCMYGCLSDQQLKTITLFYYYIFLSTRGIMLCEQS